jgi:hypothetical protein
VPGGSRLVRVSADGRHIAPLTASDPDLHWMEPRWSPDGRRIAAATWRRGGVTSIVVLDTLGNPLQEIAASRSVQGAPSWSPDGRWILFSSDRSGTADVYAASVAADGNAATGRPASSHGIRVGDAPTGLFEPQLSPSGRTVGAIYFRADGYHVGVAPFAAALDAARLREGEPPPAAAPAAGAPIADTGRVRRYTPWSSLRPRFWLPLFESGLGDGYRLGALTSGADLVGRHAYVAQVLVPTDASGVVAVADYQYAGLGMPLLGVTLRQDWEVRARLASGDVRRRTREGILAATVTRPRVRTFASATVGASVQARHFVTLPAELRAALPPAAQRTLSDSTFPRAFVTASWSNAAASAYAISPEIGVTLGATIEQRWARVQGGPSTRTYVAAVTGYRALDLPGFARHVVAARAAGGLADRSATTSLEVGGTSGGTLGVVPGYAIGSGRETFPVRGFPSPSLEGTRAVAASIEYRAPLVIAARGIRLLPLFLDRTSLSLFYDAAAAWCPASATTLCFPEQRDNRWIASTGAELNVTAAVLSWDVPYRFRLGVAHPVTRGVEAPDISWYLAVGLAF